MDAAVIILASLPLIGGLVIILDDGNMERKK